MIFNRLARLSIAILALIVSIAISVVSGAPKSKVLTIFQMDNPFFRTYFCLLLPTYSSRVEVKPELAVSYCNFDFYDQTVYDYDDFARFIWSVHYYKDPRGKFVQVTGHFDRKVFGLRADRGGQYHDMNVPGARCENYPYFVQFLEPRTGAFCLRCCQSRGDCRTNQFYRGCAKAMPGDYAYKF
ncbi:MAG: hypothetical protein J3Q66DRAFT_402418 [Benniella sp.]|nr:MAG: hypothetical protein J3Q66DRAFT_402418 [Benniella sp.]